MPNLEGLSRTDRVIVLAGAICWIAGLEFFVAEAIAAAAWPEYSYAAFNISSLGATKCAPFENPNTSEVLALCSPLHVVLNAGLALVGLFHLAGAALTWKAWPRSSLVRAGLYCLGSGSAGAMLAGFVPVDANYDLHVVGAGLGLFVGNLGILVLGLALLRIAPPLGVFSVACGAVAIAGFLMFARDIDLGLGRGWLERVAVYPQTVWYAVAGVVVAAKRTGSGKRNVT